MLRLLLHSLRPKQWTKNLLLFAGVIFSQRLFYTSDLIRSIAAFILFCAISGGLYLANDIKDLNNDRAHPLKRSRPLASGQLALFPAIITAVVLIPVSLVFCFQLSVSFGWVALSYVLLSLCYSFLLKHLVILDVMVISLGFVLRAVAGAVVVNVSISSWLLVCTIFLALFLALNKRRHELVLLGDEAKKHRKNLMEYSPFLLDLMITMVSACTLMAYALYTKSDETIQKFGSRNLVFTLPFVIYGIFRYLYLVHQKGLGGSPEQILLKDKELIIDILLWILVTAFFIYLE